MRNITAGCQPADAIELPYGYGPFLPMSASDVDGFNDAFSDELDSAFGSSICCCDFCYRDFRAHWPDVTFRKDGSDLLSMDTLWAVDYSRLPWCYSAAEISTLRQLVRCPRCQGIGGANIYLFEHRFSDADAMEQDIDALVDLGQRTPFLLLEHDFARQVLAEIRRQGAGVVAEDITGPLYRARLASDIARTGQDPGDLATYGPPPAIWVGEGRFNHAGAPMLYLANAELVAAAELGVVGQPCCVARLKVLGPLKVLNLVDIDENGASSDLFDALANSALLAAPRTGEGWVKRQYVFSRFVADCARSAGYDAIRYGSTKTRDGANYVILAPPDDIAQLVRLDSHDQVVCPAPAHRY